MRKVTVKRKTKETDINVTLDIDGRGESSVNTGIGFLDHMLTLFAKHGLFDLKIRAKGDLEVDLHHTNEDVGICLGEAFAKALKDKKGIRRFASVYVPMDEALARVVLDVSGRPFFSGIQDSREVRYLPGEREEYDLSYAGQFLQAFVVSSKVTLDVCILSGKDAHHILEAIFKALARAFDEATRIDPRIKGVPSTKGKL